MLPLTARPGSGRGEETHRTVTIVSASWKDCAKRGFGYRVCCSDDPKWGAQRPKKGKIFRKVPKRGGKRGKQKSLLKEAGEGEGGKNHPTVRG